MQRQSLGSPSSKLVKDESQSSSISPQTALYGDEECELKKLNPKTAAPHSYIHLIPLLTLLCFLILYLSSHNPSLNEFNGVKTISDPAENISELQGILEIQKGDILAVRSLKNLKQEAKQRRLHRKIPHF
ncbi:uncharacterized protein LOC125223451 [Salvia hispanica]|uniref:uncharacterized protein LOC125223451 n=1 Tax=Salvia hispanica TaxID=49212 RepID=UPI002009BF12|nr:uncharacterized protein LOC125223451 [Salvia hispanica]XP_047982566.1 uncharacterized protein LOC125223451 [Salvia hispanica]